MDWMLFRKIFMLLAVAIMVAGGANAQENLVARVGGIPITKFELGREFQKILPMKGNYHGGVSQERLLEIKEEALATLIDRAYKVRYALDNEIAVENQVVEKQMAKLREKYETPEKMEKAAGDEGVSGYRASLYRQALAAAAERVAVDQKIVIPESKIREYYEENKETFKRPMAFTASQILVKVDPASDKEEREAFLARAEELAERAQAGEDFYNLAYYNGDDDTRYVGGSLGTFHKGQMQFEFENAILNLEAGEISDPVQTRFGYHIIKLDKVEPERQLKYDEVKGSISRKFEEEMRKEIYRKWMDGLKSAYEIERFDH